MAIAVRHRYAIVYQDTVREMESLLQEDAFAALVGQACDLLTTFEVPIPEVEVWFQENGAWTPLRGADQREPVLVLLPKTEAKLRLLDAEYLALGSKAIYLYRLWQLRLKSAQRQIRQQRFKGHPQSLLRLESRVEELAAKMAVMDDIVQGLPGQSLVKVFDYTVNKQYDPVKTAGIMHYSPSTVHRQWRQVKMIVGHDLKELLSPEQLDAFFADWNKERWSVSRLFE